jgi:hypothetical protein
LTPNTENKEEIKDKNWKEKATKTIFNKAWSNRNTQPVADLYETWLVENNKAGKIIYTHKKKEKQIKKR